MNSRTTHPATLLSMSLLLLAGCGNSDAPPPSSDSDAASAEATTPEATAAQVTMPRSPSAEGARVFFIGPADGATVSNPITIEFGLEGMTLSPAGQNAPNSGHHHLLVDTGLPDMGLPIPADDNHIHYGDARSSTEITLEPGEHTLQMLFGDYLHIPHDPPLASEVITITVE